MEEKDNLSDLVQIMQNDKPTEPKTDNTVIASDGTVVTLENKIYRTKEL